MITIIQQKQIPLVGHNMYIDLLFIQNNLYDFINDDYDEYKQKLHHTFPIIYDTKVISQLF